MSTANPPEGQASQAKRGRGRPRKTEEEKAQSRVAYKAKQKRRLEKRKEMLQALRESGQLSAAEADNLAREFGLQLQDDLQVASSAAPVHEGVAAHERGFDAEFARNIHNTPGDMPGLGDGSYNADVYELGVVKRKVGRPATELNDRQKLEFIQMIRSGVGRFAACQTLGVGIQRLFLSMKLDAEFKTTVITAERAREDMCDMQLYNAAMGGDLSAAIAYPNIFRKARQAGFQRKIQVETYNLQKRQVEAQIGALSEVSHKPNFSGFTREEFDEYNRLLDKAQSGGTLSFDETAAFGRFTARILSGGSVVGVPTGTVQSESQSSQSALPAPPDSGANVVDVTIDPSEVGSTHAEMGNQVSVDAKDAV